MNANALYSLLLQTPITPPCLACSAGRVHLQRHASMLHHAFLLIRGRWRQDFVGGFCALQPCTNCSLAHEACARYMHIATTQDSCEQEKLAQQVMLFRSHMHQCFNPHSGCRLRASQALACSDPKALQTLKYPHLQRQIERNTF